MRHAALKPLLFALALAALGSFTFMTSGAGAAEPHSIERWYGDASSATGAALGQGDCDVNGDEHADTVVGAWFWDKAPNNNIGAAYVIFGDEAIEGGDLESPSAAGAARIDGPSTASAFVGFAVACAGDVNDDGFDDIGISYYTQEKAYIVLGAENFGSPDLGNLGDRGYEIAGAAGGGANVGFSFAPAGDVNADGFDDFAIAGVVADTQGRTNNGRVWIVAGKDDVANVNLAAPATGEVLQIIDGPQSEARLGQIAPAGDVDGDGTDDLVLGAYTATPHGSGVAVPGQAWVLFGGGAASVDLATIGNNGFSIIGPNRGRDRLGISVSAAGDMNDDGFDDVIVGGDGVYNAATGQRPGSAWVIRGADSSETVRTDTTGVGPAVYDCVDDDSSGTCEAGEREARGYWIQGADSDPGTASEGTGYSLSDIGDINEDGITDFAIGAYGYDPDNPASPGTRMSGAGAVWVVHGKTTDTTQDLATLTSAGGYRIDGLSAGDRFGRQVAKIGDADGNGTADFAVGGDFAGRPLAPATPRAQAGEVAVALLGDPATTTELTTSATGDLEAGDTADLTATVTAPVGGGSPAESGTVAFSRDGVVITDCDAVAVDSADGTAVCEDVAYEKFGTYSLTASYTGGEDYLDSDSEAISQGVTEDSETTLSGPTALETGESATFDVTVNGATSESPAVAGTVALTTASGPVAGCEAVALDANGEGACTTSFPDAGSYAVTATYSGTPTLRTSDSEAATVTVTAPVVPPVEPPVDPVDPVVPTNPRIAIRSEVVRVAGDGTAVLAEVTCGTGGGACRIEQETKKMRVGKKRFDVSASAPATVEAGATAQITVVLGGKVAKALKNRGKGFVRLRVGAFSDVGGATDAAQLTLKPVRG